MTHLRTASDLQDILDEEFAWRLKEIDDMRQAIRNAEATRQRTLIRAGVAMLYAHWEGFVKGAAESYLNYLSHKKFKYKELRRCFIALGLRGQLSLLEQTRQPAASSETLDFLMDSLEKPAKLPFRDAIDTQSNLSSAVFGSITGWIGLDFAPYATRAHLIDSSLLDRRNRVAHGEALDIDLASYVALSGEVLSLLRHFKTDIENAVTLRSYLATASRSATSAPNAGVA